MGKRMSMKRCMVRALWEGTVWERRGGEIAFERKLNKCLRRCGPYIRVGGVGRHTYQQCALVGATGDT